MTRIGWLGTAGSRLRSGWRPILEATAAATIAWLIATRLLDHPQPFFAPAAALDRAGSGPRSADAARGRGRAWCRGRGAGRRRGCAGTRAANDWTILTIILVTLTVAAAIGASTVLRVQMAVSALYVAVVTPPTPCDRALPVRRCTRRRGSRSGREPAGPAA